MDDITSQIFHFYVHLPHNVDNNVVYIYVVESVIIINARIKERDRLIGTEVSSPLKYSNQKNLSLDFQQILKRKRLSFLFFQKDTRFFAY